MTPQAGDIGVVGMPTWLWVDGAAVAPPPQSATAGNVTVTATATPATVVWDMGDGTRITCTGLGTPYTPDQGTNPSPTCGYTYSTTSLGQPGNAYTVTATVYWNVTWTATTGENGTLPGLTSPTATTTARIGELQLIN